MTKRIHVAAGAAAATLLLGGAVAAYAATGGVVGATGRYCQRVEELARTGLPVDRSARRELAALSPGPLAPAQATLVNGTSVDELLEAERTVEAFDRTTCRVNEVRPRLPDTAATRELHWVLAALNGAAPPTDGDVLTHLAPPVLDQFGGRGDAVRAAFEEIRSHGPFTVSSLSHLPTDRSLDVRLDGPEGPAAIGLTVTADGRQIQALDIQALDPEPFPRAGRYGGRVDIGGRSVFLSCAGPVGSASPAVIAFGGSSADWAPVQRLVAPSALFCSYDRANTTGSLSDDGVNPRTAQDLMHDGYRAVQAAGVPGPFVVVGHSNAGMAAQLFAAAHPEEVAGLLLLDSQSEYVPAAATDRLGAFAPELVAGWIEAVTATPGSEPGPEQFDVAGSYRALDAARDVAPPRHLPVTVVRHGRPAPEGLGLPPEVVAPADQEAAWIVAQERLAAFYGASAPRVAEGITHDVYLEAPQLVAEEIDALLRRGEGTG